MFAPRLLVSLLIAPVGHRSQYISARTREDFETCVVSHMLSLCVWMSSSCEVWQNRYIRQGSNSKNNIFHITGDEQVWKLGPVVLDYVY